MMQKEEIIYNQGLEIEHLVRVLNELEGERRREEEDRMAMLRDIECMGMDLAKRGEEIEYLRRVLEEREREV